MGITMTPMSQYAHFVLMVTDANDPDSPLILAYVPAEDRQGDEDELDYKELCNSFGATREDFMWLARCMATFHNKSLIDEHGEQVVTARRHSETVTGVAPADEPSDPWGHNDFQGKPMKEGWEPCSVFGAHPIGAHSEYAQDNA